MGPRPRLQPRSWRAVPALLAAVVSLAGCYGVTTQHYFAMADLNDPGRELTFYRLSINASSRFTTSQYTAGFYDANALHQLFGEVKKPDAAAVPGAPPIASATVQIRCDTGGRCEAVGPDARFTVIYGANADAMAEQIRLFAESEETGKQIGALLAAATGADAFERTSAADQSLEQARKSAADLAKQLKSLAEEAGGAANADALRRILLRAAQLGAQKAGSSAIFDTTDLDKGFVQVQAVQEVLTK